MAIYKDHNKLDNNAAEAQKWFNELNPEDIIFYMDACTYENLMEFCNIESEYGFVLSLYRESNGDFSQQEQTAPQIVNTPDLAE